MLYFLDTSYLIAITHKRDQYHADAVRVSKVLEKPFGLITTEAVLMEFGNMLSQVNIREKAFRYIRTQGGQVSAFPLSVKETELRRADFFSLISSLSYPVLMRLSLPISAQNFASALPGLSIPLMPRRFVPNRPHSAGQFCQSPSQLG